MTEASAKVVAQPFKVSLGTAIDHIARGLAHNHAQIAFPTIVMAVGFWLGALPSAVRDVWARSRLVPQIAYARARPAGATAAPRTASAK
jgi:hypothetical protein